MAATALSLASCLLACSDDDSTASPTPALEPDAGPATAAPPDGGVPVDGAVVPPDTAAGRQLAWLLELLNERGGVADEAELVEHFSPEFLQAVPVAALQQTLAAIASGAPFTLLQILPEASENELNALVVTDGTPLVVSIGVDADTGAMSGLLFDEVTDLETGRPTTWEAVDTSVAALATRTNYLVARVEGGSCEALHGGSSDTRLALGSTFKLYVLAELARQIEAGTLGWADPIVVRDALKSLPSGVLQDAPEGTEVSVLDTAIGMISISDNTATDHLIDHVGRENIEANLSRVGHGAPELNTPFITTRELFLFKLSLPDADVDTYLASDVAARRTFLSGLAGQAPDVTRAAAWVEPRRIDQIEWFASPSELCTLMAALDTLADQPALDPLHTVLSTNPGVPVDAAAFPYVAFKGGSEPGVLNLTWLVHDAAGARYFVSIGLNDDTDPLTNTTPPLVTALGIFDLLAAGE